MMMNIANPSIYLLIFIIGDNVKWCLNKLIIKINNRYHDTHIC